MEYNLVEIWLRRDPIRWLAGALAGILAGLVALAVGMAISTSVGLEVWFPIKLMGTICLGSSATDIGYHVKDILTGLFIFEGLAVFLGFIFAHFTGTNLVKPLLAMGLVWAAFSWIFIWNLFMQSFTPIFAARIPSGPVFVVCVAFGLSLASVSLFDRALRGKADRK